MILASLETYDRWTPMVAVLVLLVIIILVRYAHATLCYRHARRYAVGQQQPPAYPALLPFVGSMSAFAWDTESFLRRATLYGGQLTATKLTMLGTQVYLFQEREAVRHIMKHPNLASPMALYNFGQRYFFGMSEEGIKPYAQDDSGPSAKPFHGSDVKPEGRVDYLLHRAFHQAWSGPRLISTSRRYMDELSERVEALGITEEWTDLDDFFKFFGQIVSWSLTHAIYGPALLRLSPEIIEDLWSYDEDLPKLIRWPSILMPGPYNVRANVRAQLQRWYLHARDVFDPSNIDEDGDGDPIWGSEFVRNLQRDLLKRDNTGFINDKDFSAHDLGTLWGLNSNTVSATMLNAFHIFQDPALVHRIRTELTTEFGSFSLKDLDAKRLSKLPLLSSTHAETLRMYVEAMLMFSSPHRDVTVGQWHLPRSKTALISTAISHNDESIWNTKEGLHPLNTFWADRFMVNPTDRWSGPIRPDRRFSTEKVTRETTNPFFSTDGLDGAWIPYGGGASACPGRFLAKQVVQATCAMLLTDFDIELKTSSVERDGMRYGLGVARPKNKIPARIRRRRT